MVSQWRSRARRPRCARVVGPVAVLTLLVAVLALPPVSSAFSARTVGPASLAADQLLAPTNLAATTTCSGAATVSPVGQAATTQPSPLVLSPPSTTRPGDLLLAQVAYYGTPTVPTPTGWNLVSPAQTSGTLVTSAVYWKVAAPGEPTVSFARPAASTGDLVGGIVAYRGVDQTDPFLASGAATGKDTPPATPTLTTTTATDTLLVHFLAKTGTASLPTPAGTTERWNLPSDSEAVTAADERFTGSGTTTARSTTAGGVEWTAQSVLLRPGKVPTVHLSWTASPSDWADGYRGARQVGSGTPLTRTLPTGTTSTSDGPLTSGTTYSYRLWAYKGSWTSPAATVDITPVC
jgi:hypothetical protein